MILLPFLVISTVFFIGISIFHLDQSISNYYDFVAIAMVIGGTLSVGLVLLPWEYRKDLRRVFFFLMRPEKRRYKRALSEMLFALKTGKSSDLTKTQFLYQRILLDGLELVQLGLSKEKIESILAERVFHSIRRWKKIANAIRSLAKYPPAFGLMGTVFGLVNIMKSLANSESASKLGVEMAIALVATMYGLLVANFVVNPIGELAQKKAEEEEEYAQLALECVLMVKEQTPILEAVEMLNSFVPEEQRQTFNDIVASEEAA